MPDRGQGPGHSLGRRVRRTTPCLSYALHAVLHVLHVLHVLYAPRVQWAHASCTGYTSWPLPPPAADSLMPFVMSSITFCLGAADPTSMPKRTTTSCLALAGAGKTSDST